MNEHHDHEEDDDIVILTEDDGTEREYIFLALVEVDGQEFAALTPNVEPEDEESPAEVYLYHYGEDEEGYEKFAPIEDEALFQKVQAEAERVLLSDEDDQE